MQFLKLIFYFQLHSALDKALQLSQSAQIEKLQSLHDRWVLFYDILKHISFSLKIVKQLTVSLQKVKVFLANFNMQSAIFFSSKKRARVKLKESLIN